MSLLLQVELSDAQLAEIAEQVARINRTGKATTYSVAEAAKILGVASKTISRRVQAGVYPRIPNLKSVRISAAFIDQLVNPNPEA